MKKIWNDSLIVLVNIIMALGIVDAGAMSLEQHVNGTNDLGGMAHLRGTAPAEGGVGNMSVEKLEKMSQWMDNPSTRTGEFINRKLLEPRTLSPWNHGALRHNPINAANALYGKSSSYELINELAGGDAAGLLTDNDYLAKLNAARMHKISDVANNVADVDGLAPTKAMKQEAEVLLRYARRYNKLPLDRLPEWVDRSGAGIVAKTASGVSQAISKTAKVAGYAAPPLIVGTALYSAYDIEQQFNRGEIDEKTRVAKLSGVVGGCSAALGGMAIAIVLTPAGPLLVTLAVTGAVCYAMEYAGEKAFEYVAGYIYEQNFKANFAQARIYYATAGVFDLPPDLFDQTKVPEHNKKAYREAYFEHQKQVPAQPLHKDVMIISSNDAKTLEISKSFTEIEFNNREIKAFSSDAPEITTNQFLLNNGR